MKGIKLFFFFRRRRGQSKSAALNSRKRKIREIEELQAMLGRPWWVFFCAEQFCWKVHQGFSFFESDFSYFFCLVSMPQRLLFPMLRFFWPKLHSRKIYWRVIKNRELLNNTTLTLIKNKISQPPFLLSPLYIMVADEEKTIKKQKQAERTA